VVEALYRHLRRTGSGVHSPVADRQVIGRAVGTLGIIIAELGVLG